MDVKLRRTRVFNTPFESGLRSLVVLTATLQRARLGEYHIVDADGRSFGIVDWISIPVFGGLTGFLLKLFGSVFAAPVLTNEAKLSLPEFKKTLARAMRDRYRYDGDKAPAVETIRKLKAAQTHKEAIEAIPKR